jgi:acid stress-induced BolA-like protein IbaG/YrbA
MENFIRRLKALFESEFPGSEVELEAAGSHRVGGLLVWDGFIGYEQLERQRRLRDVLKANLSPEEQLQVSAILTMTPEEIAAAREG